MVASANGDIWTGTSTSLANISEVNKLSSAQSIMADVSQEKLWIADYDTTAAITNRTDGVVLANVSAGTPLTSSAGGFDATNKDTHVVTIEDLGSGVDEVQVATITGSPTGGTFRLKFLDEETNSIAYNASAAAVEQALEGLISIGLSNVAVTGSAGGAWTITFGADLGDQPLARIQLGTNSLTGGSSPSVAITQSTAGQAAPSRIGSYEISTIDSDTQYNLKYSPDPLNLPTSIQFSVQRSPKYYDPKTNATYHWVAKPGLGFVPVGSPFVVTWRDRAVMIDSATPWILRMSRQGDFQDWLLTDDAGDKQRPVFLSAGEAGSLSEPITGAADYSDDCMLVFTKNSSWAMRGDPALGGVLDNLSHEVGLVSEQALCHTADGSLIFLSSDGLYRIASEGGSPPIPLSDEPLPDDLRDVDPTTTTVLMAYDQHSKGIHIYLTPTDGSAGTHWYVAMIPSKDGIQYAFFTAGYGDDLHQPTALWQRRGQTSDQSLVLLGCLDGYVRYHDEDEELDDGDTEIESYVDYLLPLSGKEEGVDASLTELSGVLGNGSGNVDIKLFAAQDAESAVDATTTSSVVTWTGSDARGLQTTSHPRVRGPWLRIRAENAEPNDAWIIEQIRLGIAPRGKLRRV